MRLRDENRTLRARERTMMRTGMSAESLIEELKSFLSTDPTKIFPVKFAPLPVAKEGKMFDPSNPEIAALNLSDWHIGEVVHPLAMNGMNEHNSYIAAGKINVIVEKFLRIVRRHETMYPIEEIFLPLLGDFISGAIHRELVLSNDLLDLPATVLAARLLIMTVQRIKTLGKKIRIRTAVGNHPRTTETMPTKVQTITNMDWICYVMVQQYFEGDPQVDMEISLAQHVLVKVKGYNIILEHGYGTSFEKTGELDTKLRNVFDQSDVRQVTGNTGNAVDFVVIGDKHRAKCEDYVLVNGSLPGASEITPAWRLRPIKAVQSCWGISEENIPSFYYPLTAKSADCKRADNPFSQYTRDFMRVYGR